MSEISEGEYQESLADPEFEMSTEPAPQCVYAFAAALDKALTDWQESENGWAQFHEDVGNGYIPPPNVRKEFVDPSAILANALRAERDSTLDHVVSIIRGYPDVGGEVRIIEELKQLVADQQNIIRQSAQPAFLNLDCLTCAYLSEPTKPHTWHSCIWRDTHKAESFHGTTTPGYLLPLALVYGDGAVDITNAFKNCPTWEERMIHD